jgi:uncharacterized membrane protein YhhN
MTITLIIYALIVLALLIAELTEHRLAQCIFKPLAALGFLFIAFSSTALLSTYGVIIFAGLAACAIGDVCLLSRKSPKLFLAGMGAFALGHIAYLSAFLTVQTGLFSTGRILISGVVMAGTAGFYFWLKPKLPTDMRIPVGLYTVIILAMVMTALGLLPLAYSSYAMIGAVMFAISDMFVARDRFVTRTPKNALAITPLYFGAQALIAMSTKVAF